MLRIHYMLGVAVLLMAPARSAQAPTIEVVFRNNLGSLWDPDDPDTTKEPWQDAVGRGIERLFVWRYPFLQLRGEKDAGNYKLTVTLEREGAQSSEGSGTSGADEPLVGDGREASGPSEESTSKLWRAFFTIELDPASETLLPKPVNEDVKPPKIIFQEATEYGRVLGPPEDFDKECRYGPVQTVLHDDHEQWSLRNEILKKLELGMTTDDGILKYIVSRIPLGASRALMFRADGIMGGRLALALPSKNSRGLKDSNISIGIVSDYEGNADRTWHAAVTRGKLFSTGPLWDKYQGGVVLLDVVIQEGLKYAPFPDARIERGLAYYWTAGRAVEAFGTIKDNEVIAEGVAASWRELASDDAAGLYGTPVFIVTHYPPGGGRGSGLETKPTEACP